MALRTSGAPSALGLSVQHRDRQVLAGSSKPHFLVLSYFCAGSITRQDSAVGTGSTFTSMRLSGTPRQPTIRALRQPRPPVFHSTRLPMRLDLKAPPRALGKTAWEERMPPAMIPAALEIESDPFIRCLSVRRRTWFSVGKPVFP
jgi:hypothetical protein